MTFHEAIAKRIIELCELYNFTPNRLAELSTIPPTTMHDTISGKVINPNSYIIFKLCRTLKISLKDFYDSDLFDYNNIID